MSEFYDMKVGDVLYYPVGSDDEYVHTWTVVEVPTDVGRLRIKKDSTARTSTVEKSYWDTLTGRRRLITYTDLLDTCGEEAVFEHTLSGSLSDLLRKMGNWNV